MLRRNYTRPFQISPESDNGLGATDRDVANVKFVLLVCLLVFTGMCILTLTPTLPDRNGSYFPAYSSDMVRYNWGSIQLTN